MKHVRIAAVGLLLCALLVAAPWTGQAEQNEPIVITYFDGTWHNPVLPMDGEGVKMINERFGVDFRPEFISYADYNQKLPVKLAGGDVPDITGMEAPNANYYKWASQGAFLAIDDLVDQYPSLSKVPDFVYDAMRVNGKIYAIPRYFPVRYITVPIIRQDWLDNLNLAMPTSYDELLAVAVAFAQGDPDGNGVDDTYGIGLAENITWDYAIGAYWSTAWYHRNADGNVIPGIISPGAQERIQFLKDAYDQGAVSKDWATSKIQNVQQDFYAGKYGIFFDQSYDMWDKNFKMLQDAYPEARLSTIPPFAAPDGTQGFKGGTGYYQMHILAAHLENEPEKLAKIMEMEELFRTFVPVDERNPDNELFDWRTGGEGVGYVMVNGRPTDAENGPRYQPEEYFDNRYYAPDDASNEVEKLAVSELQRSTFEDMVRVWDSTQVYVDPINRIISDTYMANMSELQQAVLDEQSRMIVGQSDINDWDTLIVKMFMDKGGAAVVAEVNQAFTDNGVEGEWR